MIYKNAREFLKNVKPRNTSQRKYFTMTQVADGLGVNVSKVYPLINSEGIEERLGFQFVETGFNQGRYFPPEAIKGLYKFRKELFGNDEDEY